MDEDVRTVMGIKGEPSKPDDPALGFEGNVQGFGLNLRVGRDGSIEVTRPEDEQVAPPRRDERDRFREAQPDEE